MVFVSGFLSEFADGSFAGRGKVVGFAFGENVDQINGVSVLEIEIDDPGAAAFAPARQCHAGFAHATAPGHGAPFVRVLGEFSLERSIGIIAD